MTEDKWNEYLKRSKTWRIRIGHDLLHSEAYRDLSYGPAIKALFWFREKIEVVVNKRKRGKDRYQVVNSGSIEFTYREAVLRGLSYQQFSKALRELNSLGFIDVKKPGSSLRGDVTLFSISDRWRQYGTADFVMVEFPRSCHWVNFGFGGQKKC